MLRAPNGVVEDSTNYWVAGKALYDPGKITVPTLIFMPNGTPTFLVIGAELFHSAEEHALQAYDRAERRNPYGDDGKEPDAILPRVDGFPRRREAARFEVNRELVAV
jgi:hypothetical protein